MVSLKKDEGSEIHILIERAGMTNYIKYYKNLKDIYQTSLRETCRDDQTKLKICIQIVEISNSVDTVTLATKKAAYNIHRFITQHSV